MAMQSPIPLQEELLPVDEVCLLDEFRATFRNETAHMPEVSLRYLLWLVLSDQPLDDVKRFANQVRIDLNEQRLSRFIKEAPFTGPNNSVRHALAVG
ncbi:MAG: hypothetical protein CMI02_03075 [Oceanospirillaceae bacterium]|nr:hypothetical protein [Oceanospirillaceae bacterium]MBT10999.1 hypothetical protein [Oceanospirillaceae bacterium]|tara:strand:- start:68 stop:358 length:291 start_codon:yes stop_codon:yes gene_type:complete